MEISGFKLKSTKIKVNNESVSYVNIDGTTDDAVITNGEAWMISFYNILILA